jgi:exonuclease VII small subunit
VKEERILFLYFSCDYDYLIQPVVETDQPKYAPLKGGEHLFNQTAQTFQYLKKRIEQGDLVLSNARPLYSFGMNETETCMNLYELLKKCPVTPIENMPLPVI